MEDPFEMNTPEVAPVPKKRSLFSASAIAKAAAPTEGVEFFSRAKDLHPRILAEEERKRQKKLMKLERKRSSTSADVKESTPPEEKRRRVSAQAGKKQDRYSSDESESPRNGESSGARRRSSHSSPGSSRSRNGSSSHKPHDSPTSLSARYRKEVTQNKRISPRIGRTKESITLAESDDESPSKSLPVRASAPQAINLDDSDGDGNDVPRHWQDIQPVVENETRYSDEEFPELVAAAKERARLRAEEQAKAFASKNHAAKTTGDFDDIFEEGSTANVDPTIEMLITSEIEGTTALRVKRKIFQKLGQVRLAWCDKQRIDGQPMGPELTEAIFLTWKQVKLYDSGTCNGLGLKVNELGNLVSSSDGIDPDGRVHLEAWTPEALLAFKKKEAAKLQKEQESDTGYAEIHKDPIVEKIKLIFKSKTLEDFKIAVKPSTTVAKMVQAFKNSMDLPEDQQVTLHFDGDQLEDSDTVGDTELGNMDVVEVHIK